MKLTAAARSLRRAQTPWEIKIWRLLRDKQFFNYKFRRQFPIDKYIVDFCCLGKRLIIELDGSQHNEPKEIEKDRERSEYLEKQGFKILRIWNPEIDNNLEGVGQKILEMLE
ncbi:MAG: hypothetical protein A2751_02820 [Candidatus Doudnabacteria bacterium RIFCSPHIGHO2_01_FULL_46_14]|uniref:DUF559 domain-containing protein n=1 Tax=Candidatus Doudnabacteria bacterium RIFCSPHIGHO2_01_FULL_46_14 TaxID=1817824 RepID=A0A1F5NJR2_9BACT|nr:MAG: hypothetical protein A2751_02820 [Candidatus Doudnabacteria bacterium RIFCSPHIGHO2_01_FULL_46_14]